MPGYQYRKQDASQTYYRISTTCKDNSITWEGFKVKREAHSVELRCGKNKLFTTDLKDQFYFETEPCTEQQFNEWLQYYIEEHERLQNALIGGPEVKTLFT